MHPDRETVASEADTGLDGPSYARPIEELSGVDRGRFEREVVPGRRPVVLRGLIRDWEAVAEARTAAGAARYLKRFAAAEPLDTFLGLPEIGGHFFYDAAMTGFNFARKPVPLPLLLDQLVALADDPAPPAIYAGSAAAPSATPGLTAANPMPLVDDDVMARVWIGNAVTISTHHDQSENIACVVAGRRRFLLFPPEQVANLYIGPLDLTMAGRPVSLVDPDAPDLARFPRFAAAMAEARVAVLEPGDAIYMPSLWWHQVRSRGALNLLVNYWWGQPVDGPFEAMMHGLLAVRDLPPHERQAWRAMYDYYLFQDAIDPAAHIPPAGRGVLGPPSPQRRERIRAYVMNALTRRR